jgi:hypothetical protein
MQNYREWIQLILSYNFDTLLCSYYRPYLINCLCFFYHSFTSSKLQWTQRSLFASNFSQAHQIQGKQTYQWFNRRVPSTSECISPVTGSSCWFPSKIDSFISHRRLNQPSDASLLFLMHYHGRSPTTLIVSREQDNFAVLYILVTVTSKIGFSCITSYDTASQKLLMHWLFYHDQLWNYTLVNWLLDEALHVSIRSSVYVHFVNTISCNMFCFYIKLCHYNLHCYSLRSDSVLGSYIIS